MVGESRSEVKNSSMSAADIAEKFGTLCVNDKSHFRGKLLEELVYNSSGNIVSKKNYHYDTSNSEGKYYIALRSSPRSFGYYKIYLTPCLLNQTETTTYANENGNKNVTVTTNYTYNSKNQIIGINEKNSDNQTQTIEYRYPSDITSVPSYSIYQSMLNKNLLSNYITKTKKVNGLVADVEKQIFTETNLSKPSQIDRIRLDNPTPEANLPLYSANSETKEFNIENPSNYHPATNPGEPDIKTFSTIYPTRVLMELSFYEKRIDMEIYDYYAGFRVEIKKQNTDEIVFSQDIPSSEGSTYFVNNHSYYQYTNFIGANLSAGDYTLSLSHYYNGEIPSDDYKYHYFNGAEFNSTIYAYISQKAEGIENASDFKPEIYYTYNSYGNIREAKSAGSNQTTTYLWGYNHQYPVAEIQGATFSEVCRVVGDTNNNISIQESNGSSKISTLIENCDEPSFAIINGLRAALPSAQITTYKYKPLVGMIEKSDPQNINTYFDYDAFGRLQTVKDHNGKLLENHDYHYK